MEWVDAVGMVEMGKMGSQLMMGIEVCLLSAHGAMVSPLYVDSLIVLLTAPAASRFPLRRRPPFVRRRPSALAISHGVGHLPWHGRLLTAWPSLMVLIMRL
jgi:hypothetical protein